MDETYFMNDTEMRIAVAEAMGWKFDKLDDGTFRQFNPKEQRWVCIDNDPKAQPEWYAHTLPNYPTSRDACAEFLPLIAKDVTMRVKYMNTLREVIGRRCEKNKAGQAIVSDFDCVCATASEHSETFLRVKGLWKEGAR